MKLFVCKSLVIGGAVLMVLTGVMSANALTIATFADPSTSATDPLFTVAVAGGNVNGGWSDSRTGLTLQLPLPGPNPPGIDTYQNAWFTMTELTYTGTIASGVTGPGVIEFYADGTNSPALLRIQFDNALVAYSPGFGADTIEGIADVEFGGLESGAWVELEDESFAFSFANKKMMGTKPAYTGYTATAAFTCSAELVPEPATIAFLLLGLPAIVRRRLA